MFISEGDLALLRGLCPAHSTKEVFNLLQMDLEYRVTFVLMVVVVSIPNMTSAKEIRR